MRQSNVLEDIKIAKYIIRNNIYSNIYNYHNNSTIYRFSNEQIEEYKNYLFNKKKIFSITGSGDQILSSILFGAKEIDSIDISRFSKYYFELKKATIKSVSKDGFIKFLVPEIMLKDQIENLSKKFENELTKKILIESFFV